MGNKMIVACMLVLGFLSAGFTACSSGQAKPSLAEKQKLSDYDAAYTSLAAGAVDVCLHNTAYITNREASFLTPKLVAGQPEVCGIAQLQAAAVPQKKQHKKTK